MPIVQQGSINTTALVVPDLYVQIVPPQNLLLNGVPTDIVGVVGSASWGPVGQPAIVATMSDYATTFGPLVARKYDMGTHVATAVQQGARNFRCARATDGTDSAAQLTLPGTAFALTARYTGSLGNTIVVTLGNGSKVGTWRLTVVLPGLLPEVYDNIAGSGAAFWQALANAVNLGQGPQRGPSALVKAAANGTTATPVSGTYAFSSGTPGTMRSQDHQFLQTLYISVFGPLQANEKFDDEHTGWGWSEVAKIPASDTVLPTTCAMKRP